MGEQDLLYGILDHTVESEDVKTWLDDGFEHTGEKPSAESLCDRRSDFEQYDRLTFVVVLLNFLREDAAPLLRPAERSQIADHACQPATRQDGATGNAHRTEVCLSSNQGSLSGATKIDISSAEDFPPLAIGNVPRGNRGTNKQKRRIRPTAVSNAEKPSEGDITDVGASNIRSLGRMDDAAAGRLPVGAARSGREAFQLSLEAVETPPSVAAKGDQVQVIERVALERRVARRTVATPPAIDWVEDAGMEEGHCEEGGSMNLRAAASGSLPLGTTRSARKRTPEEGLWGAEESVPCHDYGWGIRLDSSDMIMPRVAALGTDELGRAATTRRPMAGFMRGQQHNIDDNDASVSSFSLRFSQANIAASVSTPTKACAKDSTSQSIGNLFDRSDCLAQVSRSTTPIAPSTPATGKNNRWMEQPALGRLASLYVHTLLRRLVPNLATEMHLTVRLLHVHPSTTRESGMQNLEPERLHGQPSIRAHAHCSDKDESMEEGGGGGGGGGGDGLSGAKGVFQTGLDCRTFAARVIMGLESLLPHVGADTLELLIGSMTLTSEPEDLMGDVRHMLNQARGDSHVSVGDAGRSLGQQHADDTAIVQNVGAPYAALQWRKEDSVNHCRTTADRALFQNQQESVDRFGSLLRNYQGSKKGLQQYPERALQDLRIAASALVDGLTPGNFGWLAQYLLAQLVGWGLAPPQETDFEVMALVAPAGDKGRATLQKLHRRISTPSSGEDGRVSKSSQKLRQPVAHPRQGSIDNQSTNSQNTGSIYGPRVGQPQLGVRKSGPGPRQSKSQAVVAGISVPMAPLQLRWFPGNQEFFYHVVMALDSHVLNSHLKTALIAEIAELYYTQSRRESDPTEARRAEDNAHVTDDDHRGSSDGVGSFTDRMVKLKVLAKFLGLLTFSPNWGIPTGPMAIHRGSPFPPSGQEHGTDLPLPLQQYLNHAWSTEGLVGAVPWIADFLRMMKWDIVSMQTGPCRSILVTLATLHAQPRMRPGHPRFTQSLLAVSCEIETLFQDLGHDLGAPEYLTSSCQHRASGAFNPLEVFGSVGSPNCEIWSSSLQRSCTSGSQHLQIFAETNRKPIMGSLDADIVLSRRLIQNCYPFLEDVLTLIANLDRTWRLGVAHGGESTPFKANRSPRLVRGTGTSPRSKRVIKPHPLRPLPVLPSVAENHERSSMLSAQMGKEQRGTQIDSARVRLVESFFHSQPGELQSTADFVVRRAVHNACEEALATVVRPAVIAVVSQLELSSAKSDGSYVFSFAQDNVVMKSSSKDSTDGGNLSGRRGIQPRTRREQRVAWTTAAVQQIVGCKAKVFAGKQGHRLARGSTLSLVPQSLPFRVRETAAAIAGYHAKLAAEKKIEELTATAASEAAISYHVHVEELQGSTHGNLLEELNDSGIISPTDKRGDIATHPDGDRKYFHEAVDTLSPSSLSSLPALVMAVTDASQAIGADVGRKDELVQAAHGVSASGGQNVQAVASVVRETLNLVHTISQQQQCGYGEIAFSVGGYRLSMGEQNRFYGTGKDKDAMRERSRIAKFLALLAEVWASLYATSPDCQLCVVNTLQRGLPSKVTIVRIFEDLTGLAIQAVNAATSSAAGYSEDAAGQQRDDATNGCVQVDAVVLKELTLTTLRISEHPPWLPALQLMLWSAISAVTAENSLLSLFQEASSAQSTATKDLEMVVRQPSPNALCVVTTGIVKGYHSWATQRDMSSVPMANILDCATDALARLPLHRTICRRYHPMNLSRVVARLTIV